MCVFSTIFYAQNIVDSLREFNAKASVQIIELKQRIYETPTDIGELLQKNTSSFIKTYGLGGISSLSVRGGSANQTKVVWNGIRINSPTLGMSDLSLTPIEFIDDLSIYNSGTKNSDASGALSGALTMENRARFLKQKSASITAEMGSFSFTNLSGSLVLGNKKWFSKTVYLNRSAENDFTYHNYATVDNEQQKREYAATQMIGVQENIGFQVGYSRFSGVLSVIDAIRHIPTAIGVQSQNQEQWDRSVKSIIKWDRNKKESKWLHRAHLGWINDGLRFTNYDTDINTSIHTDIISGKWQTEFVKNNWKLTGQYNLDHYIANSDGFDEMKSQNRNQLYFSMYKRANSHSFLYSLNQGMIDGLVIPVNMDFIYGYDVNDKMTLELNANQTYNHPTLNDLYWLGAGNDNLQGELARQINLGNRLNIGGQSFIKSNGFFSITDNWIQWIPQLDGVWRPENVRKVVKGGMDFHLNKWWKIGALDFNLMGGYQYLQARIQESNIANDESIGKDLIYTPRNSANFSFQLQHKRLNVGYDQRFTGKLYLDALNTTYLPYSVPANAFVSYTVHEQKASVTFKLKVLNVFNETYQTVANQPLPGIHFRAGFQMKFHE